MTPEWIVQNMSLEEKVRLMSGRADRSRIHGALKGTLSEHYNEKPYAAGGNDRLHVPEIRFCDGPRGVVCGRGKATCFPVPMVRAAGFNPDLEEKIGTAIAQEAQQFGANFFGGICINFLYHPGWGRAQETYGEDDFLLGEMGGAMVRGVQSVGVIACLKHFAFNQMENQRFRVNVRCDSLRTEREVFLRHFEKCIRRDHAGAVMSAYNAYNGVMCGHNRYLLHDVLKEEWGFQGFLISDFTWGVKGTVAAALAGQTVEMADTKYFGEKLVEAVRRGLVPEAVIDNAALRIVRTMKSFEKISMESEKRKRLQKREVRELALQSAEEGIVLLKNERNVLPFSKRRLHTIAVFGELAEEGNQGDRGSARVYPEHVVSPLEGLMKLVNGTTDVIYYRGHNIAHAKRLADEADCVIVIAGLTYLDEGEALSKDQFTAERGTSVGGDREGRLRLHDGDEKLLNEIGKVNPNTAVVMISGSAVIPGKWISQVPALLWAGYGGQEGGTAIARVLFGEAEPGGRLPYTIPQREEDLPALDFEASEVTYQYYSGYRKLAHDGIRAMYPFGYGLSYTSFALSDVSVRRETPSDVKAAGETEWNGNPFFAVFCHISNTGKRSGSAVVQVYVESAKCPVPTLKGFLKVKLEAGAGRDIRIPVSCDDLKYFDEEEHAFRLEQGNFTIHVGFSAEQIEWSGKFQELHHHDDL